MNMKRFIAVTAALAATLFAAFPAGAQQSQYTAVSNRVWVAGSGTTNAAVTYGLTKFEDVSIQVTGFLDGAGTGSTTFNFLGSVDGSNYATTAVLIMHLVNAGTVSTTCISNLNVGAYGYLKLGNVVAADSRGSTNNVFLGKKPQRFGK